MDFQTGFNIALGVADVAELSDRDIDRIAAAIVPKLVAHIAVDVVGALSAPALSGRWI